EHKIDDRERQDDQRERQDREDRLENAVRDPDHGRRKQERSPAADLDAVEEPVDDEQGDDVDAPTDENAEREPPTHARGVCQGQMTAASPSSAFTSPKKAGLGFTRWLGNSGSLGPNDVSKSTANGVSPGNPSRG